MMIRRHLEFFFADDLKQFGIAIQAHAVDVTVGVFELRRSIRQLQVDVLNQSAAAINVEKLRNRNRCPEPVYRAPKIRRRFRARIWDGHRKLNLIQRLRAAFRHTNRLANRRRPPEPRRRNSWRRGWHWRPIHREIITRFPCPRCESRRYIFLSATDLFHRKAALDTKS